MVLAVLVGCHGHLAVPPGEPRGLVCRGQRGDLQGILPAPGRRKMDAQPREGGAAGAQSPYITGSPLLSLHHGSTVL